MNNELDDIITYIKNSDSYKKCIEIKKKMLSNDDLNKIINKVKFLQKKYVNSNYEDNNIKLELDSLSSELEMIPIYSDYLRYLDDVNDMINLVKDELNDYFYKVLNENN